MTNSPVGNHQIAVVDVDEGVLEGSDMSGTHLIICSVDLDDEHACRGQDTLSAPNSYIVPPPP